ncbi:MAG: sel1 repeat family protein, partial [Oscillospiraceae bacterium]|nr:sel1 repeat family protein [Oscillospiraceae bacterium]
SGGAKVSLLAIYDYLGETGKAKELYAKLLPVELSQECIVPEFLTSEEHEIVCYSNIKKLTDMLYIAIMRLADIGNREYGLQHAYEERMHIIEKAAELIKFIYEDGDYGNAASKLSAAYLSMARLAANEGNANAALELLEKGVEYAIAFDTRPQLFEQGTFVTVHTSPLIKKFKDVMLTTFKTSEHNASWNLLNVSLTNDAFKELVSLIGNTDRYKAAVTKLNRYADKDTSPQGTFFTDPQTAREAADKGNIDAAYTLSQLYSQGFAVKQDDKEALKWERTAAEGGHTAALNNLASRYITGAGVDVDYAEAMRLLLKAETVPNPFGQGNPFARVNLGDLYRDGLGVEQDYTEAIRWYQLACDYQIPSGYYRMGNLYENGFSVERNFEKALEYYQKSAAPNPSFDGMIQADEYSPDNAQQAITRVSALIKGQ